jgi:CubicO group peptidase (beta-lactamase class C family)
VADALALDVRQLNAPGAAIAILENGQVTFSYGVGRRDPRAPDRVRSTTLFRVGSITKMMTALAVLQQVQAGSVDLDHPVIEYVPGLHLDDADSNAMLAGVTVRQLLDHSTGLNDYLETAPPAGERSDEALEGFFTGRWAGLGYFMVPPGTFYNYANPNYMLAGLVAEQTAGLSYRQLVRERILERLGMQRTFFLGSEVRADGDFAVGQTVADPALGIPRYVEPESYDNGWGRPAGYAWASVLELARLGAFLTHGDPAVLSPGLHDVMVSPGRDTGELLDLIRYGFGLKVSDSLFLDGRYYRVRSLQHTGAIAGFTGSLFLLPDTGFGIVTLVNGDGAENLPNTVGAALRTLASLPEPSAAPGVAPRPETFVEEVGTYQDPRLAGAVEVSQSAGQLRVAIPAATAAGIAYDPVLVATSPRNFLLSIDGEWLSVTFIHGGPADPVYLRTRAFVAVRETGAISGTGKAPAPTPIQADRLRKALAPARRRGQP